ncbi:hypothetical protein ABT304_09070 [Nocardioides sp. NPDC000445]|uniref:hypothetical protein n=1 Tax=Nocardioides sp. NPDC000445 TaxID=3154257 RepID=UPI00332B7988
MDTPQRYVPLYEAKMLHQFDHRWATYEADGTIRDSTIAEKGDPTYSVMPQYWVHEEHVVESLERRWSETWLFGWREIGRATDERTMIAPVFPSGAVNNKIQLMLSPDGLLLSAVLNSFVTDFVIRQSVGGTSLSHFIIKQTAVVTRAMIEDATWVADKPVDWVLRRVHELTSTAADIHVDARIGTYEFDAERRALIRSEIDAALFHLYGVNRDDLSYIMDSFSVVRRKDVETHGEYRTKRLILEVYDAMQAAIDSKTTYQSILSPPAGEGARNVAVVVAS